MKKTIIFLTSTAWEIGRWENWEGEVPQKGDIIFDESFPKQFLNCHVDCRVILASEHPRPSVVHIVPIVGNYDSFTHCSKSFKS